MCLGDDAGDAARRDARQRDAEMKREEEKRQKAIAEGKENIDAAFGSFNDDYYSGYTNDYTNFYFPTLDDQFSQAKATLIAALAGKGTLESSIGADALANLSEVNDKERTRIGNEAENATAALRGNVEKAKTGLYALNESSADPQGINARAIGEASSLTGPAQYTPLGEVFAAALQPYISYSKAGGGGGTPSRTYTSPYTASGQGSQRIIS